MELLAKRETKESLELQEPKALADLLVLSAPKEKPESQVLRVNQDPLVLKGNLASKDHRESLDPLDPKVKQDLLVHRESPVLWDLKASPAYKDYQDPLVHQDRHVQKDILQKMYQSTHRADKPLFWPA